MKTFHLFFCMSVIDYLLFWEFLTDLNNVILRVISIMSFHIEKVQGQKLLHIDAPVLLGARLGTISSIYSKVVNIYNVRWYT